MNNIYYYFTPLSLYFTPLSTHIMASYHFTLLYSLSKVKQYGVMPKNRGFVENE